MKCPFAPGSCVGRNCPGYSAGRCFVESFHVKLDTIALKLDTLCNLTSVMLTRTPGIPEVESAEPMTNPPDKPERRGTAPETPHAAEAAGQAAFFPFEETPKNEFRRVPVSFEPTNDPEKERAIPDEPLLTREEDAMFDEELDKALHAEAAPLEEPAVSISIEEVAEEDFEEIPIAEEDFLPGFPAKVSNIIFVDDVVPEPVAAEARTDEPSDDAREAGKPTVVIEATTVDTGEEATSHPEALDINESGLDEKTALLELTNEENVAAIEETEVPEEEPLAADTPLVAAAEPQPEEIPSVDTEELKTHQLDAAEIGLQKEEDADIPSDQEDAADSRERALDEQDIVELDAEDAGPETFQLDAPAKPAVPSVEPADEPAAEIPLATLTESEPVTLFADAGTLETPDSTASETTEPEVALQAVPNDGPEPDIEPVIVPDRILPEDAFPEPTTTELLDATPVLHEMAAQESPLEPTVSAPSPEVVTAQSPVVAETTTIAEVPGPPQELVVDEVSTEVAAEGTAIETGEAEVVGTEAARVAVEETTPDPEPWKRALKRPVMHPGAVLGIDFGTALSKVALRTDSLTPPHPVPLALTAFNILHKASMVAHYETENDFVEDSLIYFDNDDCVFCGMLAKQCYLDAARSGATRPPIQNLKTFFVRGGASLRIHDDFFPASEALTAQDVLSIYLAYLFRLTKDYLGSRPGQEPFDLDAVVRKFSLPACIEDRYRDEVKNMIVGAIAKAYCLEKWLKDELVKGVPLFRLREALTEATLLARTIQDDLSAPAMTEATAAGYNRILASVSEPKPPLSLLVVNVGAGFTDFALLTASRGTNGNGVNGSPVTLLARGGVSTGASVWDTTVRTLIFNKLKVSNGARRSNEFKIFKSRIEMGLRGLKEKLIAAPDAVEVDASPFVLDSVRLTRDELETSLPVKAALFTIRDGLRTYLKQAVRAAGIECFDSAVTEILVTGGGSFIPAVVECIRESASVLGPAFASKVRAGYVSPFYASIPNIADVYPALSVALGSAEKEQPVEQIAQPPIEAKTSPQPGPTAYQPRSTAAAQRRPGTAPGRPGFRLV